MQKLIPQVGSNPQRFSFSNLCSTKVFLHHLCLVSKWMNLFGDPRVVAWQGFSKITENLYSTCIYVLDLYIPISMVVSQNETYL